MAPPIGLRAFNRFLTVLASLVLSTSCSFVHGKNPYEKMALEDLNNYISDEDSQFHEGLACAFDGHAYGFIDKTGTFVIKPQFYSAKRFSDGLAVVEPFGDVWKYGFIDHKGNLVIPFTYSHALSFSEGLALVKSGDSSDRADSVYIDKHGNCVLRPKARPMSSFHEGYALCMHALDDPSLDAQDIEHKYGLGFINRAGEVVISPRYRSARRFSENFSLIDCIDHNALLDKHGTEKEIFTGTRLVWGDLHEGLIPVAFAKSTDFYEPKTWGFMDRTGKVAIRPAYRTVNGFSEGLAAVGIKEHSMGFIGHDGKFKIAPKFKDAGSFSEGLAFVIDQNGHGGYIDVTGKYVIEPKQLGVMQIYEDPNDENAR